MLISNFNQNTKAVECPLASTKSKWPLDRLLSGRVAGLSLERTLAYCLVNRKSQQTWIQSDLTAQCSFAFQMHKLPPLGF